MSRRISGRGCHATRSSSDPAGPGPAIVPTDRSRRSTTHRRTALQSAPQSVPPRPRRERGSNRVVCRGADHPSRSHGGAAKPIHVSNSGGHMVLLLESRTRENAVTTSFPVLPIEFRLGVMDVGCPPRPRHRRRKLRRACCGRQFGVVDRHLPRLKGHPVWRALPPLQCAAFIENTERSSPSGRTWRRLTIETSHLAEGMAIAVRRACCHRALPRLRGPWMIRNRQYQSRQVKDRRLRSHRSTMPSPESLDQLRTRSPATDVQLDSRAHLIRVRRWVVQVLDSDAAS